MEEISSFLDWLPDALQNATTVLVAIIVAVMALCTNAAGRRAERFYKFAADRKQLYLDYLKARNAAVGAVWSAKENATSGALQTSDALSLELDTQTYMLLLSAPKNVSSLAQHLNGTIQHANGWHGVESEFQLAINQFEAVKKDLMDAMREDVQQIEAARSRRKYESLRRRQSAK